MGHGNAGYERGEKPKREAEEAERKRLQEIKKEVAEEKTRMQLEKENAVCAAVQKALARKEREGDEHE